MYKLLGLFVGVLLPSFVSAQVVMTISDPYDPTKRLPLDEAGQVDCRGSKLNGADPGACVKAKQFYKQQFSNPDLRFSTMADHIRPHPLHLVRAYLTESGVTCRGLSGEEQRACSTAKTVYKTMDKERQDMMISELKEKLPPTMLVPLDGDLECSWSTMSRELYASCLKQKEYLKGMLFEERLKHNDRAMTIIQLQETFQRLARKLKCK